jgi:hypothetical protein
MKNEELAAEVAALKKTVGKLQTEYAACRALLTGIMNSMLLHRAMVMGLAGQTPNPNRLREEYEAMTAHLAEQIHPNLQTQFFEECYQDFREVLDALTRKPQETPRAN